MTVTPTFHFVCRHCGGFHSIPGDRAKLADDAEANGQWLADAQEAALWAAECLDDTCKACMPIYHRQFALEADRQAGEDMDDWVEEYNQSQDIEPIDDPKLIEGDYLWDCQIDKQYESP